MNYTVFIGAAKPINIKLRRNKMCNEPNTIATYSPHETSIMTFLAAIRENVIETTKRHHAEAGLTDFKSLPALLRDQATVGGQL